MKNKKLALFALISVGYLGACQLTVNNNTPYLTQVYDKNSKKNTFINEFERAQIGDDKRHANVIVTIFTYRQEQKYHLKQITCSKSKKISLNVRNLLNNNLGANTQLFKMEKLKPKKVKSSVAKAK